MITPYEPDQICRGNGKPKTDRANMIEFIQNAPARSLQEFILLGRDYFGVEGAFSREWLEQAKVSLQVRIGEDAMVAAREFTSHTETLTQQTNVMISETKKLGRLTWALVIVSFALLVFAGVQTLIMLYHK